jgi:ribose/xylose/arabinose/galactoside ABC-type transport system permease subunit
MDKHRSVSTGGLDMALGALAGLWALSFLWHLGPVAFNPSTGGLDLPWWGAAYYGTAAGLAFGVFMAVGTFVDWWLTKPRPPSGQNAGCKHPTDGWDE